MQDRSVTIPPMGILALHPAFTAKRMWESTLELPQQQPERELLEDFAWTWDEISALPEISVS